ncbi:MAG: type II toxin-antitoxin system ParD family antitoxin [Acidobacteriota bacterium]
MNVSLTPELDQLVREKVATGLYGSASEVVREALRLLKEMDTVRQHRLDALRRDIAVGIRQADRGDLVRLDAKAIRARGRGRARGSK